MAYQIRYDSVKAPKGKSVGLRGWMAASVVVLLIAGALVVKSAWLPWVQDVLLPGDPAVTAAALEEMMVDLREGQSLKETLTAFCREILANAE